MSAITGPNPAGGAPHTVNLDIFRTYEEGKHRRYSLLFSVNGGAFAIAKILAKDPPGQLVVGSLRQWQLSIGMVAFTILMVYDIYKFGSKMSLLQKNLDEENHSKIPLEIFGDVGKEVLVLLGALLCLGWLLAGFALCWNPVC
jgi:hypothetical protein